MSPVFYQGEWCMVIQEADSQGWMCILFNDRCVSVHRDEIY